VKFIDPMMEINLCMI